VLNAVGDVASKLRGQLGESLATVEKFDVPLEQATTSSLEALQAYNLGLKAGNQKDAEEALPYDYRTIKMDPNFAMAYQAVGFAYWTIGEIGRAGEYFTKAFELRAHASEREKLIISGDYYANVSGELDKAERTHQELIESYPRDGEAYNLPRTGLLRSRGGMRGRQGRCANWPFARC
jgi:tetratricopeptide (TPR) repeat protein